MKGKRAYLLVLRAMCMMNGRQLKLFTKSLQKKSFRPESCSRRVGDASASRKRHTSINIIITDADWLTEWGALRVWACCQSPVRERERCACMQLSLSPFLSLSLWPVNRVRTHSSLVRERERERGREGEREREREREREKERDREIERERGRGRERERER